MMYKDTDITASLIADKFPSVHAEILAQATANAPQITAESLKASHPDIVAQIMKYGEDSVDVAAQVTAERERIMAIQKLSRPGAEQIITDALANMNVTANDVKLQLFDLDEQKRSKSATTRFKDGETLAKDLQDLSNPEGADGQPQEKKDAAHGSIMKKLTGGKQ